MIADLKPYSDYKDLGAPWFGDVPGNWDVKRLGTVFSERNETNEKYEVTEVLSVLKDIGVIPYSEKGRIGNKKSEDIGRYKIVRPDDLVVNCMNVIIGSLGRSRYTGCLSPVYYVLKRRKSENLPRYLELVFQHKTFQRSLVRIGNGILAHRMRIPMEKLKAELFPVPPPAEQAAIVRFLNWTNGRLELAIRAKRKVIALLNEQKQAIIHRAVTRGIDPSVPFKPSGIPWLGDIPQHWEVHQLRRLVRPGRRITYGIVQPGEPDPNGRFMIRGQDYSTGWAQAETIFRVSSEIETPYSRSRLSAGDLVVTIVGAGVGNVAIVPDWLDGANITQTTARVSVDLSKANPAYVALVLQGPIGKRNVERYVKGAAQPGLNLEHVRIFLLPAPPLCEQARIVESTKSELCAFDTTTERLKREIDLLREYRTRLVADVVTGKFDVREAAVRLPDEALPESVEDDTDLTDETEVTDEEAAV